MRMMSVARLLMFVALMVLPFGGCTSGPTKPSGPAVQIAVQNLAMRTGETQTLTVSGGDGVQYTWSLNTTAGTLVPAGDKKSAVLTAGASAVTYIVTVASG